MTSSSITSCGDAPHEFTAAVQPHKVALLRSQGLTLQPHDVTELVRKINAQNPENRIHFFETMRRTC